VTYLERFGNELAHVGIRGRLRARILAEAGDHLAEGDEERFGDPAELARLFANGLAADRSRRAALVSFGALAVVGVGFAAACLAIARAGWPDIASGKWAPLGIVAALGLLVFPQFAFAAGLLAFLRAVRLRGAAAEIALLLTRTRAAIVFGGLTLASLALYGIEFRLWWLALEAAGLAAPLLLAVVAARNAAVVKSSVTGEAGDVFDDLPVRLPPRPWLLCWATAAAAALATLAAAPNHEGIRNGIVEVVLVLAGFLGLGKRLGLRR
jgi:hypothetical protein